MTVMLTCIPVPEVLQIDLLILVENSMSMLSEKQKMLEGLLYNASDPELLQERKDARVLLKKFNDSLHDPELRKEVLSQLIPFQGKGVWMEPPFFCDYGYNIVLGNNVYFNFNCIILDVVKVIIGENSFFGPAVQIYTATHPLEWQPRSAGAESGKPVTIGSDVWVGGGSIICPGVTIGNRSVIGAGSVVVKDIPDDVLAVGNPCKVIRSLVE